jgi:glycosyltransferase involved in cell wall biosynthesis
MPKTSTKNKVAIIIPAYNEGMVIKKVVSDLSIAFQKSNYIYDIIVINDGSKDNTNDEAQAGGAIVINHIINQGAGGATSTGLRYAYKNSYTAVATMDADGQHDPEDVLKCIDKLKELKADLIIGSRLVDTKGMSRTKIIGNKGLSFITWLLFGVSVTDSQSGLRVLSRKALAVLEWKSTGYEFCSEMLWRAKQSKLKIIEVPIKAIYTDYSKSKGQNNWNAIHIIKSLIRRRIVEFFE